MESNQPFPNTPTQDNTMSAFQVSTTHIAAIATYGAASINQAKLIAGLLTEANAASVAYRYRDEKVVPDVNVHAIIKYFHNPMQPAEVLKLISCLDYQSCEVPGWETNYTKTLLDGIQTTCIMDRYGDAGTGAETIQADAGYKLAKWSI